jgi:hypothetical protein
MPYPHISFWVQSQCKTVSQPPESRLNLKYKNVRSFAPFTLIYDIADNSTQHARTPMLQAPFIFWANGLVGKCLSGQMSFWANVFWANVFLGKCLSGQMSFWANVFWANGF